MDCEAPHLGHEARVYKHLKGGEGIPQMYFAGEEGDYRVIVMDLLGPSIQDLFAYSRGHFSLQMVIKIGLQMIKRVEFLHLKQYVHRDIKPENFLIGMGKNEGIVYLIDFGLSKKYVETDSGNHVKYREDRPFSGVIRYASLNAHKGIEQSRRDDIESIGNILIYLIKGCLPWQFLSPIEGEDLERLTYKAKSQTTLEVLCSGLPCEFLKYMKYCRNLKYEEQPDYTGLSTLLQSLLKRIEGDIYSPVLDWSDLKKKETKKASKTTVSKSCLLYTSPSPRDLSTSRMPSSA
eukprot:TRINITY_DN2129_c0_g1_i5.p1 TRINITY_DN2129_c0_g1~~TRINITY_DN2129_c0_g1_i5.p1  ORF type:complete len:291 (-),score=39.28 TRINITY_DN2129_c0_g1_i5:23-895(-)